MPQQRYGMKNAVCEWGYISSKKYPDPFNEIELDVIFSGPDEKAFKVPAYWAGGQEWRIRFAAPATGNYTFKTLCSNPSDAGLHGQCGTLTVQPYDGGNGLLAHGRLRVSASRRHLEHQDGTPFFWLADTWWMGLCRRLTWPEGFQLLTDVRVHALWLWRRLISYKTNPNPIHAVGDEAWYKSGHKHRKYWCLQDPWRLS